MKPITRQEVIAIITILAIATLIGIALGYMSCTVSGRYRYMMARAEESESQRDYYEKQAAAIISEGLETSRKKKGEKHGK
jgi:hypothetical protein